MIYFRIKIETYLPLFLNKKNEQVGWNQFCAKRERKGGGKEVYSYPKIRLVPLLSD